MCVVIIFSGTAEAASIPGTTSLCLIMPALYALQSGLSPEEQNTENEVLLD
jgi:hypothetical protein